MEKIKRYIPFTAFWLLNSLFLYLASVILPKNFVFGTSTVPKNLAFLWSGAWLTFIVWFSKPIFVQFVFKLEGEAQKFIFYWVSNSLVIWLLARVAEFSGFGISRFYWAIIFGLLINIVQWSFWQILKKYKII